MAVVRRQGVDLLALVVQGEREVLAILDPEVAVEAALEIGCLPLQLVGIGGVLPDLAREACATDLRIVRVTLQLAGGARKAGDAPVAVGDRVPGVFPALVLETGLLVAALIGDVAFALEVGVLVDPVERRPRLALE